MSNVGPDDRAPGRTLRNRVVCWLAVAPILALASLVHAAAPAMADDACFLDQSGAVVCPEPQATTPGPPASLINEATYRKMTAAQAAAMHRFEERAVDGVLRAHGLPTSDADDVRNWQPDEADALLRALVTKAIATPPTQRTPDEQQAAKWIGDAVVDRIRPGMLQAGAEYASWAGLNLNQYWNLVNSHAPKSELTAFLSRLPQPYNSSTPQTSTGGFCKYSPPASMADEYTGRTWQTCYTPCTTSLGKCEPPVEMEQFVRWGQARVAKAGDDASDMLAYVDAITSGAQQLLGSFAAQSIIDAPFIPIDEMDVDFLPGPNQHPVSTTKALGKTFFDEKGTEYALNDVQKTFRNAKRVLAEATEGIAKAESVADLAKNTKLAEEMTEVIDGLEEGINRATKFARIGYAISAEVIILAYQTAIEDGIDTVKNAELPARLASDVFGAESLQTDYDPYVLESGIAGGDGTLRSVFAQAIAPSETSTDPRPVRTTSPSDPHFMVQAPNAATWTQTSSLRLGNVVNDQWVPTYVRASGSWWVETWNDAIHGAKLQSLRLHYTNWDMHQETAWLVPQPDGGYAYTIVAPSKTADFDLATCKVDHTCWTTNSIHYLDPDGNPRIAFLEPYHAPTGSPTTSTTAPKQGQPVAFDAGRFSPGDPRGMVTYQWRFQQEGCAGTCTIVKDQKIMPDFTAPVTGDRVSHTWQTPGTYQVELTATDLIGHTAVKTLTVTVGNG